MDKYYIQGGHPVAGEVHISGAKNAVLTLMAASLLTEEEVIIKKVPYLSDVKTMTTLLEILGKKVEMNAGICKITQKELGKVHAPYEVVSTMRASIAVVGPLLAKWHRAQVSLPGGCNLGGRPVDLHIYAMEQLGAKVSIQHGDIIAENKLKGNVLNIRSNRGVSVLATQNAMMAATLAEGETLIHSAAEEPEVVNLGRMLQKMGAKIEGIGTSSLRIQGVSSLSGVEIEAIPDRIETGTWIALVGLCQGDLWIRDTHPPHLKYVLDIAKSTGIQIEEGEDYLHVECHQKLKPITVETLPFPYFPTDLQSIFMAMVLKSQGISTFTENIFESRFAQVPEFERMGAKIKIKGSLAIVEGVDTLSTAKVMASDLRSGAALVVAACGAEPSDMPTEIQRIYHIDRGYENFEQKLQSVGVEIERIRIESKS